MWHVDRGDQQLCTVSIVVQFGITNNIRAQRQNAKARLFSLEEWMMKGPVKIFFCRLIGAFVYEEKTTIAVLGLNWGVSKREHPSWLLKEKGEKLIFKFKNWFMWVDGHLWKMNDNLGYVSNVRRKKFLHRVYWGTFKSM